MRDFLLFMIAVTKMLVIIACPIVVAFLVVTTGNIWWGLLNFVLILLF